MKKILFLAMMIVALASCKKDSPQKENSTQLKGTIWERTWTEFGFDFKSTLFFVTATEGKTISTATLSNSTSVDDTYSENWTYTYADNKGILFVTDEEGLQSKDTFTIVGNTLILGEEDPLLYTKQQ